MPASWVAASVRAKLIARRRLGPAGARALAAMPDGLGAVRALAATAYGREVKPEMTVPAAERAVAAALLWDLRLLAGWIPPGGAFVVQPLAAWFEIANVQERLAYLAGGPRPEPFHLGRLATAWRSMSAATTPQAIRASLARSRWGDPGSAAPEAIVNWMRFRWAGWVALSVPGASGWAASATALLAARLVAATGAGAGDGLRHLPAYGLPAGWQRADSATELARLLPPESAWVLESVRTAGDLWRAEARWWARVAEEARERLVRLRFGPNVVVGATVLIARDAWLARAALAAAAGGQATREAFDAIA